MKKDLKSTMSLVVVFIASIIMTFLMCINEVNATSYPSAAPSPSIKADARNNGIYWIDPGATYRSGSTLQFYATGDGYGPEEPQESNPA